MTQSQEKKLTVEEIAADIIRFDRFRGIATKPFFDGLRKQIAEALLTFAAHEVEKATEPLVEALEFYDNLTKGKLFGVSEMEAIKKVEAALTSHRAKYPRKP